MNTCPACLNPAPDGAGHCPTCGQPLASSAIPMALPTGSVLQGKYRIEGAIGQGGFGITYKAVHLALGQNVAIKEYFPDVASRTPGSTHVTWKTTKSSIDLVTAEARSIARFNHPGIVRVSDVFEENNTAYVVMELLQGITLEERIAQDTLSSQEAIDIGIKAAEALSVVHEQNVLHRDLKPANIFLAHGRVVLIDFGSAREFVQGKTVGHTRLLSPGYAPLEQYASAARMGPYTDIYALGATLYHALTGFPPPDALNRTQGVAIDPLPSSVPSYLKQAIGKALEVEAAKRPQSTAEWIRLLQNAPAPQPAPSIPNTNPSTLENAEVSELATLEGHKSYVLSVAFSPGGKTLASGSGDHTIKLWDVASGKEVATLEGHSDSVSSVAFSPDGKTIASGSGDNTIKLWDVATRRVVATLRGHSDWVDSVAFSPDGKTIASGSIDDTIKLWDVATRREIVTLGGHSNYVRSVAFSPDGKTLASGGDDYTIKLWDVAGRREVATLRGHSSFVWSVAFSPDGKTLASGSSDKTIKLWDVATRRVVATLRGHSGVVNSVAFSPDGETLASGSWDNTITLRDVATKQEVTTLRGHSDIVGSVAISPDGQTLASGSVDDTVKLWRINP